VRESLQSLASRIDALPLRQRGILLLGVLVLIYLVGDRLLLLPLDRLQGDLQGRAGRLHEEMQTLDTAGQRLVAERRLDPNAELRAQLTALRGQIAQADAGLGALTSTLIPPERMAEVMESLIDQGRGLHLVRLEGIKAEPVGTSGAVPLLYRHGLRLVLEGGYLQALEYVRLVERLPWRLLWDRLAIEVKEHPRATIVLQVFTLSLEEALLGV
jgi:MSHA biogenesis protein MshJ